MASSDPTRAVGGRPAIVRLYKRAHREWRKIATAAAAVLAVGMGFHVVFGQNGLTVYQQNGRTRRCCKASSATLQRENELLKGHVERLQSDPNAIEHQAREELHYTRPGEVIYTLPATPSAKNTTSQAQANTKDVERIKPLFLRQPGLWPGTKKGLIARCFSFGLLLRYAFSRKPPKLPASLIFCQPNLLHPDRLLKEEGTMKFDLEKAAAARDISTPDRPCSTKTHCSRHQHERRGPSQCRTLQLLQLLLCTDPRSSGWESWIVPPVASSPRTPRATSAGPANSS